MGVGTHRPVPGLRGTASNGRSAGFTWRPPRSAVFPVANQPEAGGGQSTPNCLWGQTAPLGFYIDQNMGTRKGGKDIFGIMPLEF